MRHEIAEEKRKSFFRRHPIALDDGKAPEFYKKIIADFNLDTTNSDRKIAFVLVAHLLHTLPFFVEAISTLGLVAAIIPKQSVCVPEVVESINELYGAILKKGIPEKSAKELLQTIDDKSTEFLKEMFTNNHPFVGYQYIILDHGGYFAPQMTALKNFNNIMGIVEHTWNGEIKYSENHELPKPVFSIARIPLKTLEDFHIADSIVTSMKATVYGGMGMNQDVSRLDIGIIGFGHLGKKIALLLKRIECIAISIVDNDENARKDAQKSGFHHIFSDVNTLEKSDLIIVATSSKAITKDFLERLKNGACIACVTSSDDLFKSDALKDYERRDTTNKFAVKYTTQNEKVIYLAADGGSVNFLIGSTAHPILHAVLSAVYVSICRLIDSQQTINSSQNSIQSISYDDQKKIQKIFEPVYGKIKIPYKITIENLLSVLRDYVVEPVIWDMFIGTMSAAASSSLVLINEKILSIVLSSDVSKARAAAITYTFTLPLAIVMAQYINKPDWMNTLGSMVMWSTAGVVTVLDIPIMIDTVKRIDELSIEYLVILGLCGVATIPMIMKAIGNKAVLTTAAVIMGANILGASIGIYMNLVSGYDSKFEKRGLQRAHSIACHGAGRMAVAGVAAPILNYFGVNPLKIAGFTGLLTFFDHRSMIDSLPDISASVLRPLAIGIPSAALLYSLYRMVKAERGISSEAIGIIITAIIASSANNLGVDVDAISGAIIPGTLNSLCYFTFCAHYGIFKRVADAVENANSVRLILIGAIVTGIVGVIYAAHQISLFFATIIAFPFGVTATFSIINALNRLIRSAQTVLTSEVPAIIYSSSTSTNGNAAVELQIKTNAEREGLVGSEERDFSIDGKESRNNPYASTEGSRFFGSAAALAQNNAPAAETVFRFAV